jgi:hypothetical protein
VEINVEIGDKIKTLVEVLDKRAVGLTAVAPTDLAGTKLLQSTIEKYAPPFISRVDSLSLPLLYATLKEKFPEVTPQDFQDKVLRSEVGVQALQETLTYITSALQKQVQVEDLRAIIQEVDARVATEAATGNAGNNPAAGTEDGSVESGGTSENGSR